MTAVRGDGLPVADELTACLALRDQVGPAAVTGMIDRFLLMLPDRVDRLRDAVAAGEWPELRDAALSLGCSATMLGAHPLAAACARAQGAGPTDAAAALVEVERLAGATAPALAHARGAVLGRGGLPG